ncbi:MAG: hypothetical protein ACOVOQ_00060 [Flavobacterium sp.]
MVQRIFYCLKDNFTTSPSTSVSTFASGTSPSIEQSLQKSLHLSHPDKIELNKISYPLENKKYATTLTKTTKTVKRNNDSGLQTRWTRTPAGYGLLPQLAVTCKIEVSVYYQTVMLVDSEMPSACRQAVKSASSQSRKR